MLADGFISFLLFSNELSFIWSLLSQPPDTAGKMTKQGNVTVGPILTK